MKRRIAVAVGALIALVLIGSYVPWHTGVMYRCSCCGAHGGRSCYVCVPVRFIVRETALSKYWRREVEPSHKHDWIPIERCEDYTTGAWQAELSALGHPRWSLSDECAISVLSSLPDTASRKVLMTRLWGRGRECSRPESKKLRLLIGNLEAAYSEDPSRRDWPAVLRRLGVWPSK